MKMKMVLGCAALAMVIGISTLPAEAKGCIKGAVIGTITGHLAGHHAVAGAAAGCVIGHHEANKKQKSPSNTQ